MSCESWQEKIDEQLAVGVPLDLLPGTLTAHIRECSECREFAAESVELNRFLEEPLPLPPADLAARVMAAVQADDEPAVEERTTAVGERLVWAVLGGVMVLGAQALAGAASSDWTLLLAGWVESLADLFPSFELTFSVPETSATLLLPMAASLALLQGGTLWALRRQGAAR